MSTKIAIEKLRPHPMEPARLSRCMARKLSRNIQTVEHYEPVVVRPHGSQSGAFEILSGQALVEALRKMGHSTVNCDIWEIDPIATQLFLAIRDSVNGVQVPELRMNLLFALLEKYNPDELGALLPEGATYLRNLLRMRDNITGDLDAGNDEICADYSVCGNNIPTPEIEPPADEKVIMTMHLTRSQHAKVNAALNAFMAENGISDMVDAFVRIVSRST